MTTFSIRLTKSNNKFQDFEIIENQSLIIGRINSDIVIEDMRISREHLRVENKNAVLYITDLESSNGTFVNNKRLAPNSEYKCKEGDTILLSSDIRLIINNQNNFDISDSFTFENNIKNWFKNKSKVIIGRHVECDVVLSNDFSISRQHAVISLENNRYYIEDLNSTNGTFVNGERIHNKTLLFEQDSVLIGLHKFSLRFGYSDLRNESAIKAVNVQKFYPSKIKNQAVGLHNISFSIPNKSFVALMGPSGCGKSTLLKALNGDNPATAGKVYIHGLELLENYQIIKRKIGYVPQDDIVHKELTVEKSLFFAAKLRMGDGVCNTVIKEKIDEVLTNLNINSPDIRTKKISKLSGGQRKRVSIAVELLNNPSILFLDEPTSPLDPETIEEFLKCLKNLSLAGTTIVMVTHKPEDLNYVDSVIFLTAKGYHAYYGNVNEELFNFFETDNIINIYSKLSKEEHVKDWHQKWSSHMQVADIEDNVERPVVTKNNIKESFYKQLYWLSNRYLQVKLNDTGNMLLLLAQPLVISILLISLFDKIELGVLFLISISAIWFGVSNAAKEIVGEIPIYRRERMFNLNILAYILSKTLILSFIALIQVIVFITIVFLKYNTVGDGLDLKTFFLSVGFMFYLAFSATLLGLLLSAFFSNTEKVITIVPITLMPQIMLAGMVARVDNVFKEIVSYFTLGRWGTEGFARIQDSVFVFHNSQYHKTNALAQLNLYNSDGKLLEFFNSFSANIVAITLLNIIVFYGLFYFIKKKDSL